MKALSVLVVDDASFIRDLIKRSIRGRFPKFKVEDAINGKKAIQLIKNGHFDLCCRQYDLLFSPIYLQEQMGQSCYQPEC